EPEHEEWSWPAMGFAMSAAPPAATSLSWWVRRRITLRSLDRGAELELFLYCSLRASSAFAKLHWRLKKLRCPPGICPLGPAHVHPRFASSHRKRSWLRYPCGEALRDRGGGPVFSEEGDRARACRAPESGVDRADSRKVLLPLGTKR